MSKFYYNSIRGTCDVFTYGGCRGNGNRFTTEVECQMTCAVRASRVQGKVLVPTGKFGLHQSCTIK